MITIGQVMTVTGGHVPLAPWGESRGEGAVIASAIRDTPPLPGADDAAQFLFGHSGRAGLSLWGEASQVRAHIMRGTS